MTHEEIKILISAYFDGEVSQSEKNIAEEHLKECQSCQKDLSMYKAMSSSLSKWPNETLSPDEEINVQKRFEQRREPMFTKRTLMTLGTTLAITIIVGSVVQVQLKKGVQGRLKSSADNIGDQYSDGNTNQLRAREYNTPGYFAQAAVEKKSIEYRPNYMQSNMAAIDFNKEAVPAMAAMSAFPTYAKESVAAVPQFNDDRKIIKNADMTLKVQSAQNTQSVLESIVGKYNGTVNSLNMDKLEDGSRRGVMVFSVPPQSLDNVLREIRKLGEVDSENQTGSDVTNQYSYIQARLASYESERERLQKVLKKSVNDVDNSVYVQGQISGIEENMNDLESGLKELDKQSFMATVTVNFYDIVPIVTPKEESLKDKTIATFKDDLKNTLEACYHIAINSFSGIIIVLSFLFQIGLWALLFWGIYLIVNRIIKK